MQQHFDVEFMIILVVSANDILFMICNCSSNQKQKVFDPESLLITTIMLLNHPPE